MSQAVPESRAYRHQACGEDTVISGQPFEVISNPLGDMSRTWCTKCNMFFPIAEFSWSDTSERISDYWARHSVRASSIERYLCSRAFMLWSFAVGFVTGCALGYYLFRNGGVGAQIIMTLFVGGVGLFLAAALHVSVITKFITKRVCGVNDTRVLT